MNIRKLSIWSLARATGGLMLMAGLALACTETPSEPAPTYTVGGMVSGLAGSGLVLRDNGGDELAVSANGSVTFATKLAGGADYSVTVFKQPSSPVQSCAVTNGSRDGGQCQRDVRRDRLHDQHLHRGRHGLGPRRVGAGYCATMAATISPSPPMGPSLLGPRWPAAQRTALLCLLSRPVRRRAAPSPEERDGGRRQGYNRRQIACATNTYTVGGTVSGLVGSGLVLRDNGGDDLAVSANGPFTFATGLGTGAPYSVSVFAQPSSPAQRCTVRTGMGTMASANVTSVAIVCTTNPYTVGGTVSGLVELGMVLRRQRR